MSTGKEIGEMVRDLEGAGLDVRYNGHYLVRDEQGQRVTLPATPGSHSSVKKSRIAAEKLLRGEPVHPESDHSGPNTPGKAVSDEAQPPPADDTGQAGPIRRGDKRAQQAAEEAAEARAAEQIEHKGDRKARPEAEPPKPRPEFVRPKRKKSNKTGGVGVTSPTGQPAMYNSDVACKNGKEVRPEDIHPVQDVIDWAQAKKAGQAPSCFSCWAPGATGALFVTGARLIDRRDIHIALGKPFKQAVALATLDHRRSRTTEQQNGEYVTSGAMALCGRCHGRFSRSAPPGAACYWFSISDWPAYLAGCVHPTAHGAMNIRIPSDPLHGVYQDPAAEQPGEH